MNVDKNCESDNRATLLGSGMQDYTNLQLVQPTLQLGLGGSSGRVSEAANEQDALLYMGWYEDYGGPKPKKKVTRQAGKINK